MEEFLGGFFLFCPAMTTTRCHHPRKRMIQYAAAIRFSHQSRGVLDTRIRGV
ncbi:hypothetical protein V1274_000744 [Bradyrhizobium sp. AZCC 1614]|uniref:hypothetical protein n=1 Tax=Bradyrhizobium sp. AZCC 1614 TaxID=3117017 RepID=UPI002FF1A1B8